MGGSFSLYVAVNAIVYGGSTKLNILNFESSTGSPSTSSYKTLRLSALALECVSFAETLKIQLGGTATYLIDYTITPPLNFDGFQYSITYPANTQLQEFTITSISSISPKTATFTILPDG